MAIPNDYEERVHAGVLGMIIGVYLGRPSEGCSDNRIMAELGEIWYYVHERLGRRLVVTDDDISGTFTFLRCLPDYGNSLQVAPAQIGQIWLNHCIENRAVHWWGGYGNSTCHTAFIRLLNGVRAPASGSAQLNGKVISEEICAQIFIDGWAMVAPGDPELAADLACRAASVAHDSEAIYAAQALEAMESLAFVEPDTGKLLETALSVITKGCDIYRLICELREPRACVDDWHMALRQFDARWGMGRVPGYIPIQTNHGRIILCLLYGDDSFQKALMVTNTSGCDTDYHSGSLGCLMGIKNCLAGLSAGPDFRGPVEDHLYLVSADGGRAITDAVNETYHIANAGRAFAGLEVARPKGGARFHYELPGSTQCFRNEDAADSRGTAQITNAMGHSRHVQRSLAICCAQLARGREARVSTATFILPEAMEMPIYGIMACPTLYSGQSVRARVAADEANSVALRVGLYISTYGSHDRLERTFGPQATLAPGDSHEFQWHVPDTRGQPIAEIGLQVSSEEPADGMVYLDYLTWDGPPRVVLGRPQSRATMWRRAWVDAIDQWEARYPQACRLIQNRGRGMLIQGTREWTDYSVSADVTLCLVKAAGIAARVRGMERYYALLLCDDGKARLVEALNGQKVLCTAESPWELGDTRRLRLDVRGIRISVWIQDDCVFDIPDAISPLTGGAVALVCEEGRLDSEAVAVRPVD